MDNLLQHWEEAHLVRHGIYAVAWIAFVGCIVSQIYAGPARPSYVLANFFA